MAGKRFTGASAAVHISPDTTGFGRELHEQLAAKNINDVTVPVNFNPDTGKLRSEMARLEASHVDIGVRMKADSRGLEKYLADTRKRSKEMTITPKVKTDSFHKTMLDLAKRSPRITLDPKIKTEKAIVALKGVQAEAKAAVDPLQKITGFTKQNHRALQQQLGDMRTIRQLSTVMNKSDASNIRRHTEDIRVLTERIDEAKKVREALFKMKPNGGFTRDMQKLNRDITTWESLLKRAERGLKIDYDFDEVGYERTQVHLHKIATQAAELNDKHVRVKVYVDGADSVRRQMESLLNSYTDLPNHLLEQAHALEKRYLDVAKKVKDNPDFKYEADLDVDTSKLGKEVERFKKQKLWDTNADDFEKTLDGLRKQYIRLPESLEKSMRKVIDGSRQVSENFKKWSDYRYEGHLDLDTREAREEVERFKKHHDKLKMDAEIETLGASAHLAYLTRPRTVNIFARVRDTNLGKVLNGITFGATGFQGVTNQFDRLVKMFDSLDKFVPRLAALGSVMGSITVGGLNLAGSLGAIGTSLGVMSKGLLAAPALMGAFGTAMWLMAGFGDKNAYKFDWDKTALGGMRDKSLVAFWDGITPKLKAMADQIAPTLNREFLGIAKAYGTTAGAMLDMIAASDKMGVLPRLMENTRKGVEALGKPAATLTETFLALGDQSSSMFPRMVEWLNKPATYMREWVRQAEATGAVTVALQKVSEQGSFLKDTFFDLSKIIMQVFKAFNNGQNGIEGFSQAVHKAAMIAQSSPFTETLHAWIDGAQQAKVAFHGSLGDMGRALYNTRTITKSVFMDMGTITSGFISTISSLVGGNGNAIASMSRGIADGFNRVYASVQQNKSVFGDFLSMIGSLSRAFGTTLAASLRATAPLLSSLAKTAELFADIASRIPEPILGAIGLWRTFGASGLQALNALKVGFAEHLVQMAQYRLAMESMGAGNFKGSGWSDMIAAWGKNSLIMSKGIDYAEKSAAKATTTFGKFRLGGEALLASMGGFAGVLGTLGVGAAIAGVSIAWSDYAQHTQKAAQVTDSVTSSLKATEVSAEAAAKGLTSVGEAYMKQIDADAPWGTGFLGWVDNMGNRFKTVKDAGKALGYTSTQLGSIIENTGDYYKTQAKLNKIVDDGTKVFQNYGNSTGAIGQVNVSMDESAQAAEALRKSLKENHDATIEKIKADNQNINVTSMMIDQWDKAGVSISWLSAKTRSAIENDVNYAQASQMLAKAHTEHADSMRRVDSAGTSYGQMLNNLSESIKRVQAAGVSQVWDEQAHAFNYLTQAGQTAQSALSNFATTSLDYIQAMVSAGRSQAEVTDSMNSMRNKFIETAQAMGVPRAAAEQLATQYGLVPSQVDTLFKAETEASKLQLLQYLNLIAPLMDNKQYEVVMKAITQGAITDIETLNTYANTATQGRNLLINVSGVDAVNAQLQAMGLQAVISTSGKTLTISGNNADALNKIAQVAGVRIDPKSQTITMNSSQWEDAKKKINQWTPDAKTISIRALVTPSGQKAVGFGTVLAPLSNAQGGLITGPGTGTSDSIPSWLSNGEYVLKASAVKKLTSTYGLGFLNSMNQSGSIPAAYGRELAGLIESSKHTAEIASMRGITVMISRDDKALVNAIDRTRMDVVDAINAQSSGFDPFAEQAFNRAVYRAVEARENW